jgi:hypothetical protein
MIFKRRKLNVRQMQVYCAVCLSEYCEKIGLSHPSIDELILHLLSITLTKNLMDWEISGRGLMLSGRGDPIPWTLEELVVENKRNSLLRVVELCVEVGIIDMYGAETNQPKKYMNLFIKELKNKKIKIPDVSIVDSICVDGSHWGRPATSYEYQYFCQNNLKKQNYKGYKGHAL